MFSLTKKKGLACSLWPQTAVSIRFPTVCMGFEYKYVKNYKSINKDPRDVHMSCVPYSSAAEVVWRWAAA